MAGTGSEPITLNKYAYVNADPVNHIDPSGHFSLGEVSVAQNVAAVLIQMQIQTGFSLLDKASFENQK